MADNFLSWPTLATFSGAVAAVVFLVQFLKVPLDTLKKVPTRIVVYGVSFVVLLVAKIFTEPQFNGETVALCIVNAVLVALAAMSLYEQTIAEPEAAKNANIVDDTAKALASILATAPVATAASQTATLQTAETNTIQTGIQAPASADDPPDGSADESANESAIDIADASQS